MTRLTATKKYRGRAGFTLIEMLLYVSLVAIIAAALVSFGFWAIQVLAKTKVNSEVTGNARRALETMVYEIKKSASVYTPTSIFDANSGQLSLEQTIADGTENSEFVDFFLCGQSLCLKREKTNPVAITSNAVRVTNLNFSQRLNSQSAPSIKITLTVISASAARPEETASIELTTAANLRSY